MSEGGDIAITAKSGKRLEVLILGGYGTFGRRLVELLSDAVDLDIVIAGRSGVKAATLADALNSAARLQSATIDRDGDIDEALATVRPDIVVDASGPFQAYGADPYRVARACLRHASTISRSPTPAPSQPASSNSTRRPGRGGVRALTFFGATIVSQVVGPAPSSTVRRPLLACHEIDIRRSTA